MYFYVTVFAIVAFAWWYCDWYRHQGMRLWYDADNSVISRAVASWTPSTIRTNHRGYATRDSPKC